VVRIHYHTVKYIVSRVVASVVWTMVHTTLACFSVCNTIGRDVFVVLNIVSDWTSALPALLNVIAFSMENPSLSYAASPAIWDHTEFPATGHMWTRPLTSGTQAGTQFTCPRGMDNWVERMFYLSTVNPFTYWPLVSVTVGNRTSDLTITSPTF